MNAVVVSTLQDIELGPPASFHNLTMLPLLPPAGRAFPAQPEWLTLDDAEHHLRITELDGTGSVPELMLENRGERPVLLLDGEELIGAKQNRVLNLTVLAPPHRKIVVPVSCVEAGRWHHVSEEFRTSPRLQFARGRARKLETVSASMRTSGDRLSDQDEVWRDIAEKQVVLRCESPTSAMADVYQHHAAGVDEYVSALPPVARQVGALFALDGEVIGLDLFDHPVILAKLLPKLVRSYALDALESRFAVGRPAAPGASSTEGLKKHATAFLAETAAADERLFPAVGLGEEVRLHAAGVSGGALVVADCLVHLAAFRCNQAPTPDGTARTGGRMRAASERRQRTQEWP
jgi:hypothetical protein